MWSRWRLPSTLFAIPFVTSPGSTPPAGCICTTGYAPPFSPMIVSVVPPLKTIPAFWTYMPSLRRPYARRGCALAPPAVVSALIAFSNAPGVSGSIHNVSCATASPDTDRDMRTSTTVMLFIVLSVYKTNSHQARRGIPVFYADTSLTGLIVEDHSKLPPQTVRLGTRRQLSENPVDVVVVDMR